MTVQHVHFLIELIGLKSEIEALTGLQQGSRLAYATDTDELGTYDGAAWHWGELDAIGTGWDGNIVDIDETSSADIGEELAENDQWLVFNASTSTWVRAATSRIRKIVWRFKDSASDSFASNPQNDWSPSGFNGYIQLLYVIPPSDGAVLNGLNPGADGQILGIHNSHATRSFILADEAAASTAAYRFSFGGDVEVKPGQFAFVYYDDVNDRWEGLGKILPLELSTDPAMNGAAAPGTAVTASASDHVHPTDTSLTPSDGWISKSETWTRTGDYTFTISGDLTAAYRKGTKVRYKDGGAYEYGVIYSSSYSDPNTTVTLITNSDYAMAAATITDTYLSYTENPEGWPEYFNFAASVTGAGSMTYTLTTTNQARYQVEGALIHVWIDVVGTTGGTASTALLLDSPVAIPAVYPGMACAAATRDATSGGRELAKGSFSTTTQFAVQLMTPATNYGLGTGRIAALYAAFIF